MAVDLLDAPLRISWDFCPLNEPPLSRKLLLSVAEQLTAGGIFFVTLEAAPLAHPDIQEVLSILRQGGCQVALLSDGSPAEVKTLARLDDNFALFIDAGSFCRSGELDESSLAAALQEIRQYHKNPALLWTPVAKQLALLPELLHFCTRHQVGRFKLPNQKISVNSADSAAENLPDCSDLEELEQLVEIKGLPAVDGLQLEVHDLFLWELLQPLTGGQRSEYGGCQAANSLGHISVSGELFPCSSWPLSLGSLLEADLLDLWQSAQRLQIRKEIAQTPAGCDGCRDYSICFGGCRGLSSYCRKDGLGRDLLCHERR